VVQKTIFSVTKIKWLRQLEEITGAYSENHTEIYQKLGGERANVKTVVLGNRI